MLPLVLFIYARSSKEFTGRHYADDASIIGRLKLPPLVYMAMPRALYFSGCVGAFYVDVGLNLIQLLKFHRLPSN